LQECDNEDISFLKADEFVHLLYDDNTFRRSRLYFWAVACLTSFEQSITDTLSAIALCKTEVLQSMEKGYRWRLTQYYMTEGKSATYRYFVDFEREEGQKTREHFWIEDEAELNRLDSHCWDLEQIREEILKKRDEIRSLRDGVQFRETNLTVVELTFLDSYFKQAVSWKPASLEFWGRMSSYSPS